MGIPKRYLLLDAAGRGKNSAEAAFLADFAEALLAYERLSALRLGLSAGNEGPSFCVATWSEDAGEAQLLPDGFDAAVIAFDADAGVDAASITQAIAAGAKPDGDRTLVFAAAVTGKTDTEHAREPLASFAISASNAGLTWGGGLAIAGRTLVERKDASPRMGFWRHRRSEATDQLVNAARAGLDLGTAVAMLGENGSADPALIIDVPAPWPARAFRLLVN